MALLRIHTDEGTIDIEAAPKYVEHLATKGVWITANKFLPPQRIVFIELLKDDKTETEPGN